jgi:hypothetical protein
MPKFPPLEKETVSIKTSKIILAEGIDAYLFLIHLLNTLHIAGIQVINSLGITDLTNSINTLKSADGYEGVNSILILRDSENSTKSAIQSVNHSLQVTGLIDTTLELFNIVEQNGKRICFALFPGFDENQQLYQNGTLEDLCLKIFKDQAVIERIDAYLSDFQTETKTFKRPHKNKLHATLSFTDKYVGMKIGDTTKVGGFDFASAYLAPFLDIINSL